jgi:hypothetical protein
MSDYQTRVTTDLGATLQQLDAVAKRMEKIEQATKRANAAAKDHQATVGKGLGAGAAKAAQRFGGPVGQVAGSVAGGANMEGVLGKVAVGAAVVGFAFRALNSVIDARVASERQVIELTGKLSAGFESAAKTIQQQALAGLGQEDGIRRLVGRGGTREQAKGLADELSISDADATDGLADAMLEFGKVREGIIEAAKLASNSGQMGFSEAVAALRKDRFAKTLAAGGRAGDAAARVVGDKVGDSRMTAAQINGFARNLDIKDTIISQFDRAGGIKNKMSRNELSGVENGTAVGALQQQLAEALNPQAAALLKWNKELAETLTNLDALAKAQGTVGAFFADLGILLGGEGSERNKGRRLRVSAGRALSDREQ